MKGKIMEKGLNSTIIYSGKDYHIQTEDWGEDNPYLVSQVFQNGAVKKSFKTPYEEIFEDESFASENFLNKHLDKRLVRLALRLQHQKILDLLLSGELL